MSYQWDSHGALVPHYKPNDNIDASGIISYMLGKRRSPYFPRGTKRRRSSRYRRRRIYKLAKFARFQNGKPRGRGYVKRYNKIAFRGRPRLTAQKVAKCIEQKVFHAGVHADSTALGAALSSAHTFPELANTTDKIYLWAPMQGMVQFNALVGPTNEDYTFNNECIWLRGLSFEGLLYQTSPDQYRIRLMVWKINTRPGVTPFHFGANTPRASSEGSTSTPSQKYFQFFDQSYPVANDSDMFTNRKNPNSGSKCLYDRIVTVGNPLAQSSANVCAYKKFKIWIPLNQMFKFQSLPDSDLSTAPNFGSYGDYYFAFYWITGTDVDATGATPALGINGLNCRVYFKDP